MSRVGIGAGHKAEESYENQDLFHFGFSFVECFSDIVFRSGTSLIGEALLFSQKKGFESIFISAFIRMML